MPGTQLHFLISAEVVAPGLYRYHEFVGGAPQSVRVLRENGQLWVRFTDGRASARVADLHGGFEGPLSREGAVADPHDDD